MVSCELIIVGAGWSMSLTRLSLLVSLMLSCIFIFVGFFFFFLLWATHFPGNLTVRPRLRLSSSRKICNYFCQLLGHCWEVLPHWNQFKSSSQHVVLYSRGDVNSDHKLTKICLPITSWEIYFSLPVHQGWEKQFFLLSSLAPVGFISCTPENVGVVPVLSAVSC